MEKAKRLIAGVDTFTLHDLFMKAAALKRLGCGEGSATSPPIKEYILDDQQLARLEERGIKRQARPDCNHGIFTLVDQNPQEKVPGWASSNYWNFGRIEGDAVNFDLRVVLQVEFRIDRERRGIVFVPQAHGSFVSAVDRLPNFRMFKVLVDGDRKASALARELAASDGTILVTWTNLGLGGIRRLADLFAEFAGHNATIMKLAQDGGIFTPPPYSDHQKSGDAVFVVEPAQPRLFQMWRGQLDAYRASLVA